MALSFRGPPMPNLVAILALAALALASLRIAVHHARRDAEQREIMRAKWAARLEEVGR